MWFSSWQDLIHTIIHQHHIILKWAIPVSAEAEVARTHTRWRYPSQLGGLKRSMELVSCSRTLWHDAMKDHHVIHYTTAPPCRWPIYMSAMCIIMAVSTSHMLQFAFGTENLFFLRFVIQIGLVNKMPYHVAVHINDSDDWLVNDWLVITRHNLGGCSYAAQWKCHTRL